MKKVKTLLLSTILVVMFNGCAKDGETGPQGPQGNANVTSLTLIIPSSGWVHLGTSGQPSDMYEVVSSASNITNDIVTKGTVSVFASSDNGAHWTALPFTFHGTNYSESWSFSYGLNQIVIDIQDSDHLTVAPSGTVQFKVVATASSNRIKNPNVNWNDYYSVKSTYNLAD